MKRSMIACAALAAVLASGCASLGELVGDSKQAANYARQIIADNRAYWQGELDAAVNAGDADRIAKAQQELSDLNSFESDLDKNEAKLADYIREDGTIDEGKAIREGAAMLPFPGNLLVGVGGPLALLAWREWKNRQVIAQRTRIASEIVESLEDGRDANPALADEMTKAKSSILASQSTETRRFVKQARRAV